MIKPCEEPTKVGPPMKNQDNVKEVIENLAENKQKSKGILLEVFREVLKNLDD